MLAFIVFQRDGVLCRIRVDVVHTGVIAAIAAIAIKDAVIDSRFRSLP
jgi:hypothetical protein